MTAPGDATRYRHRRRLLLTVSLVLGAVMASLLAAGTAAYVFPREDSPRRVDAVVVLGGLASKPVTEKALQLADDGYTDLIVISDAFGQDTRPANLCASDARIEIECFRPDPGTTQGEARAIARYAQERGWRSVIVVTSTYHVTRARVLIERCFTGDLAMIGARQPMSAGDWAHQYLYQTGGFIKAWLSPDC